MIFQGLWNFAVSARHLLALFTGKSCLLMSIVYTYLFYFDWDKGFIAYRITLEFVPLTSQY